MYENSSDKNAFSEKFENFIYKIYDSETKVVEKILNKVYINPYTLMISTAILILGFGIGATLLEKQHPILTQNIIIVLRSYLASILLYLLQNK